MPGPGTTQKGQKYYAWYQVGTTGTYVVVECGSTSASCTATKP
ncbi:hypothetical protein [Paragemmobacter straminiformis]|nr:hypothetical protein [Gemmobacter straminiformis]